MKRISEVFLKMKYAGNGEVIKWYKTVPSYILRGISHTGHYTDILFINDVRRTIRFPVWTDHLFILNKMFILVVEKNRHP